MRTLITLWLSWMIISCSHPSAMTFQNPQALQSVQLVAVLPFENLTDDDNAAQVVTELFTSELFRSGKVKVLEAGELQNKLREKHLNPSTKLDRATAAKITEALGVDALFCGAVLEYSYLHEIRDGTVIAKEPVVGLQARLVDKSGQWIWSDTHARSSQSMIMSNQQTLPTIAKKAVSEMVAKLMVRPVKK